MRWSQKAQDKAPAPFDIDRLARPQNPVESTALRMRAMEAGNGVTPPGPPGSWSLPSVGANRMPCGRRMPEEAKAWGNAQDMPTSGRYLARESGESEAMRQNSGSLPAGGLAKHSVAESPPACLPPPKAAGPSHEAWRCQHGTQASEATGEVMVCS